MERKDEEIRNLENNLEVVNRKMHDQNAQLEALKQHYSQELRSIEEKTKKEHNEMKYRYEQRI